MNDKFVSAFLEKLIMLEKSTGQFVHYKIMPPFQGSQDLISIQRIAKEIAAFVGIEKLVFSISFIKQQPKIGGIIELSHNGDMVFIEIDPSVTQHPQALYATLCHEISHKWLHLHGISVINTYDNEVLTDITAVYLGFGKIMLNGCEETPDPNPKDKSTDLENKSVSNFSVGYLNRDQLSFTYSVVCSMRKIPKETVLEGLNEVSLRALKACHINYGQYLNQGYHSLDYGDEGLLKLRKRFTEFQLRLATLDKIMTYLKKVLFEPILHFYSHAHKTLQNLNKSAEQKTQDSRVIDPALHYLNMVELSIEFDDLSSTVKELEKNAEELINLSSKLMYTFNRRNPINSSEALDLHVIVTCPIDQTKIRLPKNSGNIIVKCPNCGYSFAYNTKTLI